MTNLDDLEERLREIANKLAQQPVLEADSALIWPMDLREAANTLASYRKEIERLREALAETYHELHACASMMQGREGFGDVARALGKARAALKGGDSHE